MWSTYWLNRIDGAGWSGFAAAAVAIGAMPRVSGRTRHLYLIIWIANHWRPFIRVISWRLCPACIASIRKSIFSRQGGFKYLRGFSNTSDHRITRLMIRGLYRYQSRIS